MKLSLCMTCMNRLEYLSQTIDISINSIILFNQHNKNQFELSLCNYDSKDGLHEFIFDNYQKHIDSGLLVYTKVENKDSFFVSHAKNISYKYSNGTVLVNLDSDNIMNLNILNFYNSVFSDSDIDNVYVIDDNCWGIIGISRNNFYNLGGYNEEMIGYGYEDIDLQERIQKYIKCNAIKLPSQFDYYNKNIIHQSPQTKYKNHHNVKPNGEILKHLGEMMEYNRGIKDNYLEKNIMNPNEYNGIEFGKI